MSTSRQPVLVDSAFRAAWYRGLVDAALAVSAWVERCAERAAQRRALEQLDRRLLRDVGLTPEDVEAECRRWFRLR